MAYTKESEDMIVKHSGIGTEVRGALRLASGSVTRGVIAWDKTQDHSAHFT